MVDVFVKVLEVFWVLIKYPLYFILFIFVLFFLLVGIHILLDLIKGRRFKESKVPKDKRKVKKIRKRGFFKRLLYDLPKQFKDDLFDTDPDFFRPQGLIIFEGKQGAGKTVAMTEYAIRLLETYPLSFCMSNYNFKHEKAPIRHWTDFVDIKNDIYGIIILLDELQNWFSSNESRNFPPRMLDTITQNRKNRRTILRYYPKFSFAR